MADTAITLKFGDGEYRFWLPMKWWCKAEELCGGKAGPKSLEIVADEMGRSLVIDRESGDLRYVGGGATLFMDVYQVIRCAAIGGGECIVAGETRKVSPLDADNLVNTYVDGRPFSETVPVAWQILNAALNGVALKKKVDEPEAQPAPDESQSPSAPDS